MTVYLPGEVWQDRDGGLWFVVAPLDYFGSHMRSTSDVLRPAERVEAEYGPLSLVYQPTEDHEAGEES